MTKEIVREKLNLVFRELFDNEMLTISEETTASDIEEWDSLANINLILMIEEMFRIKISTKELSRFDNIGYLMNIIYEKKLKQEQSSL